MCEGWGSALSSMRRIVNGRTVLAAGVDAFFLFGAMVFPS